MGALLQFVTFLLMGLIAGWIAGLLTKGRGFGVLGNIVVGIMGALVGAVLFGLVGITAHRFVGQLILAVVGAVVFLFLLQLITRKPR